MKKSFLNVLLFMGLCFGVMILNPKYLIISL